MTFSLAAEASGRTSTIDFEICPAPAICSPTYVFVARSERAVPESFTAPLVPTVTTLSSVAPDNFSKRPDKSVSGIVTV